MKQIDIELEILEDGLNQLNEKGACFWNIVKDDVRYSIRVKQREAE